MKYRNKNSKKSYFKFPFKISNHFLIAMLVSLAVIATTVACFNFIFKNKRNNEVLPEQASVLNYDVSNMNRSKIEDFIHNEINPQLANLKVTVRFDDRQIKISGSAINLHVDADDVFDIIKKSNSNNIENIPPDKLIFDRNELERLLTNFKNTSQILPADYSYKLNIDKAKLTVSAGHDGRKINISKTLENIIEAFAKFQDSEIEAVFDDVSCKNKEINFDEIKKDIECDPEDAGFVNKNGATTIKRERVGVLLPSSERKKITDPSNGTYILNVKITHPKVTVSTLKQHTLKDKRFHDSLGRFSTSLSGKTANGIFNIRKAARAINNIVLLPGDVFSFDAAVEAEKRAHPNEPYREAITYNVNSPTGEEMGIGGGMCQVSSTIFNAALKANLPIVERQSHSYLVKYVPIGQDAGYSHGSKDLKFKNNQSNPIIIKADTSGSSLNCQITGLRTPNNSFEVTVIPEKLSSDSQHIRARATQIVKQNGTEVSRKVFNSCYRIKPKDKNKPVVVNPMPPEQPPAPSAAEQPQPPATQTPAPAPTASQPTTTTPTNKQLPTDASAASTSNSTQPTSATSKDKPQANSETSKPSTTANSQAQTAATTKPATTSNSTPPTTNSHTPTTPPTSNSTTSNTPTTTGENNNKPSALPANQAAPKPIAAVS